MTDIDTIRKRHVQEGDRCVWCIAPRGKGQSWPCDTRVVLDALDRERARGTTWLNTKDAARADAERLARAARVLVKGWYGNGFDPATFAVREALRQHDALHFEQFHNPAASGTDVKHDAVPQQAEPDTGEEPARTTGTDERAEAALEDDR
jgi:hypothetical protein